MRRRYDRVCRSVALSFVGLLFSTYITERVGLTEDTAKKPTISIESPIFSFGSVTEGALVSNDFIVKNKGEAPLTIQKLVAGCGCTATSASTDSIAPGQEGKINVTFDTSGFSGEKVKTVRVFTNDTDTPQTTLTLKGNIENALIVEPVRLSFGEVRKGSSLAEEKEVTVRVKDGTPVTITSVKSYSKAVAVKEIEGDSKHRKFSVSITPDASLGELRDRVVVTLAGLGDGPQAVNVPIVGIVKGSVAVKPQVISFGVIEGTELLSRSAQFDNVGPDRISIQSLKSDNDAVTASLKTIKDGKQYVIHVTVDPSKVTRDLRASVQIITDNKEQDTYTLNIYGVLPPKV